MTAQREYDVFLSYNRRDALEAKVLATRLVHEAGLRVWMDQVRLQPGFSWRAEIETAMNAAGATILLWGPYGLGEVQRQERDLSYVIRDTRPDFRVLYVLLPNSLPPQGSWANVDTWLRFASSLDEHDTFAQLVFAIKGEALPTQFEGELPDQPAPYRGLAAFGVDDERFFYGRTAYVDEMYDRLLQYPFLALLGPSGSGKTSVVQAGLLARLKSVANRDQSRKSWLVIRPGPNPVQAMAVTLSQLQVGNNRLAIVDLISQKLRADPGPLPNILPSIA